MGGADQRLGHLVAEHGATDQLLEPVTLEHRETDRYVRALLCEDCGEPTRIFCSRRTWQKKLKAHIERFGCPGPFALVEVAEITVADEHLVDQLEDGEA